MGWFAAQAVAARAEGEETPRGGEEGRRAAETAGAPYRWDPILECDMLDFHRRRRSTRPVWTPELRRMVSLAFMAALAVVVLHQMGRQPAAVPYLAEGRLAANATSGSLPPADGDAPRLPPQKRLFSGIPPKLWDQVRDDTPLRASEHEAFFRLLRKLAQTPPAELAAQTSGPVAYTQLLQQPKAYRGEMVTLVGRVRRAFHLSAARNQLGVDHLYQTWLEPADRSEPVVIYLAELPPGFPEGMDLDENVQVHAVFFKRWPYRAASGLRSAPLLLARTLQWQRPAARTPPAQGDVGWGGPTLLLAAMALAVVMLGALTFWFRKSAGCRARFRMPSFGPSTGELQPISADPRAFLRELAQASPPSQQEGN